MDFIKSPIRYPGAKGRAIPKILPLIPDDFIEYREPFVGGGSIFLAIRQKYPERKYWINDLNQGLYNFWEQTRQNPEVMVMQILAWKKEFPDGKQLLQNLRINSHKFDDIQLACVYYINKTLSFSGFTRGFSENNFQKSFTQEKIEQLKDLGNLMQDTRITNLDYQKVVEYPGENVFVFCCLPGTKIRMKNERLLNIEDINIGDKTFLGGDVLKSINRNYNGDIYEFDVIGIHDNLCVTVEHPLAVIKQKDAYDHFKRFHNGNIKESQILNKLDIIFARAKDINIGDFLLIPCYPDNVDDRKTAKICDKIKEKSKRKIITKGNKRFILAPITNIYKRKYQGPVYNLATENHVYVGNFILNHNCDPPYFNVKWDELYGTGKVGKISDRNLHASFDHHKFADVMKKCKHKFLITYDDSQTVRRLFSWANIMPFKLTYTSRKVKMGEELFISNYLEKISLQKEVEVGGDCGWG